MSLAVHKQIKSTLKDLRKDFRESQRWNLIIGVLSFVLGIALFAFLFSGRIDLKKYTDVAGPLATSAGGLIATAFTFQLREFVRDKRKLRHITGLQKKVEHYVSAESLDDQKFFQEHFMAFLTECFK